MQKSLIYYDLYSTFFDKMQLEFNEEIDWEKEAGQENRFVLLLKTP